jgi:hypothetical protein
VASFREGGLAGLIWLERNSFLRITQVMRDTQLNALAGRVAGTHRGRVAGTHREKAAGTHREKAAR